MDIISENKYCVIQFIKIPYVNIDKYVTVPVTWMKRSKFQGIIVVAYPRESPVITKQRVLNYEKQGEHWHYFKAIIKYNAVNFLEADVWISIANKKPQPMAKTDSSESSSKAIPYTLRKKNSKRSKENENYETSSHRAPPTASRSKETGSVIQKTAPDSSEPQMKVPELTQSQNDSIETKRKRTSTVNSKIDDGKKKSKIVEKDQSADEPIINSENSNKNPKLIISIKTDPLSNVPRVQNISEERVSPQCNAENEISTNSSSQSHQASKDYLFQDRNRITNTVPNSTIVNNNDGRHCHQVPQHKTTDKESSPILLEQSESSQPVHEQLQSFYDTFLRRSPKTNVSKSTSSINATKNVSSDLQESSNSRNKYIQDSSQHESHANKVMITRSERAECIDKEVLTQRIRKNIKPDGRRLSSVENTPCQVSEPSHDEETFKIQIQQDSHINNIIVTRNSETINSSSLPPSQSITRKESSSKVASQRYQSNDQITKQQFQPQKPQTVRKPTAQNSNPFNVQYYNQNKTNYIPYAQQHLSRLQNVNRQWHNHSNYNITTSRPDYPQQIPQPQMLLAGEPVAARIPQRIDLQNNIMNIPSAANPSEGRWLPQQLIPNPRALVRGYLMEDPLTGEVYITKSNNVQTNRLSAATQGASLNTACATEDQLGQYYRHQDKPLDEYYTFQKQRVQESAYRTFDNNGIGHPPHYDYAFQEPRLGENTGRRPNDNSFLNFSRVNPATPGYRAKQDLHLRNIAGKSAEDTNFLPLGIKAEKENLSHNRYLPINEDSSDQQKAHEIPVESDGNVIPHYYASEAAQNAPSAVQQVPLASDAVTVESSDFYKNMGSLTNRIFNIISQQLLNTFEDHCKEKLNELKTKKGQ